MYKPRINNAFLMKYMPWYKLYWVVANTIFSIYSYEPDNKLFPKVFKWKPYLLMIQHILDLKFKVLDLRNWRPHKWCRYIYWLKLLLREMAMCVSSSWRKNGCIAVLLQKGVEWTGLKTRRNVCVVYFWSNVVWVLYVRIHHYYVYICCFFCHKCCQWNQSAVYIYTADLFHWQIFWIQLCD